MPFEREDIIKINGITLYARNDDWGQSGKQSGNKVLLTDETSSQQTDCQLDAVDFHIEAYYLGEDYQNVVSKLYKIYKQQKNMLLEHHDIGRVWVKFANGGYRIKKTNTKLWYREFVLNLVLAKTSDLKIQVVELEQLAETQQNIQTAIDLIKQTAIVKACDCVTEKPFETKESIKNAIKDLEKVSDSIILAAEDNKEIQNDIHNVVNQAVVILQSQPVFNARQIQTNICLPAAVICRDENCDEETFLRVNEIRHPLFVPAGVALEITEETADE